MLVSVQGYFIDLSKDLVGIKVLEIVIWAIWPQALLYYVKDLCRLCFLAPINGNVLQRDTSGDGPSQFGLKLLGWVFIWVISWSRLAMILLIQISCWKISLTILSNQHIDNAVSKRLQIDYLDNLFEFIYV